MWPGMHLTEATRFQERECAFSSSSRDTSSFWQVSTPVVDLHLRRQPDHHDHQFQQEQPHPVTYSELRDTSYEFITYRQCNIQKCFLCFSASGYYACVAHSDTKPVKDAEVLPLTASSHEVCTMDCLGIGIILTSPV